MLFTWLGGIPHRPRLTKPRGDCRNAGPTYRPSTDMAGATTVSRAAWSTADTGTITTRTISTRPRQMRKPLAARQHGSTCQKGGFRERTRHQLSEQKILRTSSCSFIQQPISLTRLPINRLYSALSVLGSVKRTNTRSIFDATRKRERTRLGSRLIRLLTSRPG